MTETLKHLNIINNYYIYNILVHSTCSHKYSRFYSLDFVYTGIHLHVIRLIIPDSIHAKALLRNVHTRHTRQLLVTPAVHLDEAQLVVAQSNPLVAEVARADGVGVTTAGGCGVDEELALNLTRGAQLEGSDVAGHVEVVGAGGGEQVLAALGGEGYVAAVLVARGEAYKRNC